MERKASLAQLDLVRDMILQSIAERYQKSIEQALQHNQEHYTQALLNTAVAVQENITKQLHQNQNLTPSELQKIVADHKKNEQISTYQDGFIQEVVAQSKNQLLLSQKLEMAYTATKEFIEQHQEGFSKEEIQKLVKENLLAQQLSKEESRFLTTAVNNALDNEYKPTGKFTEKEKGIPNDMLSQLTNRPIGNKAKPLQQNPQNMKSRTMNTGNKRGI